jgi:hypothetical protein
VCVCVCVIFVLCVAVVGFAEVKWVAECAQGDGGSNGGGISGNGAVLSELWLF